MTDILGLEEPAAEANPTPASDTEKVTEVHNSSDTFEQAAAEADAVLNKLLAEIAPVGKASPFRRFLIYGDPGTTKTSFACGQGTSTEFTSGVLNILVEKGGDVSLENHPECAPVRILKFKALRQVEYLIDKLSANPEPLADIHTVVLDTFTTLQERDLREIAIAAAQLDSMRNPNLNIGSDYQQNTEHMKTLSRKLADMDRNVIVICHVKEEKDESTGRVLVRPQLTPKLAQTMAGMFDMVGYMTAQPGEGGAIERRLQVHPTLNIIAKTRIGNLAPVLINPKVTDLLKPESYQKGKAA